MHKHDEVKLIDKEDFAKGFNLKDGGYMKVEQYKQEKNEIIAVVDKEKYQKIEMEQKEMKMKMERDKGFELSM